MKYLVVGGAGYIGSHMVKQLLRADHEVVVADNFSTGHRRALVGGKLVELDIADAQALDALFAAQHFDAVFHFASFIQVGESVTEPAKYYQNNLAATLTLLQAMVRAGIKNFIFPRLPPSMATLCMYPSTKNIPRPRSTLMVAASGWWSRCLRISTVHTD